MSKTEQIAAKDTADTRKWYATLNLEFRRSGAETVLADNTHRGPLRVQRTFKESDGSQHVYILHPPGGYVAGDVIDIHILNQDQCHVVATSPSASKFYRCLDTAPQQHQTIHLRSEDNSLLEWLPQETIFFRGANAKLQTTIELSRTASFIGWEVCCLGRTASGESFATGQLTQTLTLQCEGELLHRERFSICPADPLHVQAWGLGTNPVFGTLIARLTSDNFRKEGSTQFAIEDELQQMVAALKAQFAPDHKDSNWSMTTKNGIVLLRYLGNNSEYCKAGFSRARQLLLKQLKSIEPVAPRIWAT